MDELSKLPRGCYQKTRSDGSSRILPPLPKVVDTRITSRSLTKEEFEAMTQKKPEQTIQDFKAVLDGKVRNQAAIEREYQGSYLLEMKERAKNLTAESGFSPEAIACWEAGIDKLVSDVARFI